MDENKSFQYDWDYTGPRCISTSVETEKGEIRQCWQNRKRFKKCKMKWILKGE